jgi:ABC-type transporter Mla MlaB component
MATAPGSLDVARAGSTVYVRVKGLGIATIGLDLWDFAEEMGRQGYTTFIVDLAECQSFDSTFMGVLVGVAEVASESQGGGVMVIHPSPHHKKLMSEVGLTKIITLKEEPITVPPGIEMTPLYELARTSDKRMQMIREAHEQLCELDDRNRAKFGAFLEMLSREMGPRKKAKTPPTPKPGKPQGN